MSRVDEVESALASSADRWSRSAAALASDLSTCKRQLDEAAHHVDALSRSRQGPPNGRSAPDAWMETAGEFEALRALFHGLETNLKHDLGGIGAKVAACETLASDLRKAQARLADESVVVQAHQDSFGDRMDSLAAVLGEVRDSRASETGSGDPTAAWGRRLQAAEDALEHALASLAAEQMQRESSNERLDALETSLRDTVEHSQSEIALLAEATEHCAQQLEAAQGCALDAANTCPLELRLSRAEECCASVAEIGAAVSRHAALLDEVRAAYRLQQDRVASMESLMDDRGVAAGEQTAPALAHRLELVEVGLQRSEEERRSDHGKVVSEGRGREGLIAKLGARLTCLEASVSGGTSCGKQPHETYPPLSSAMLRVSETSIQGRLAILEGLVGCPAGQIPGGAPDRRCGTLLDRLVRLEIAGGVATTVPSVDGRAASPSRRGASPGPFASQAVCASAEPRAGLAVRGAATPGPVQHAALGMASRLAASLTVARGQSVDDAATIVAASAAGASASTDAAPSTTDLGRVASLATLASAASSPDLHARACAASSCGPRSGIAQGAGQRPTALPLPRGAFADTCTPAMASLAAAAARANLSRC